MLLPNHLHTARLCFVTTTSFNVHKDTSRETLFYLHFRESQCFAQVLREPGLRPE